MDSTGALPTILLATRLAHASEKKGVNRKLDTVRKKNPAKQKFQNSNQNLFVNGSKVREAYVRSLRTYWVNLKK
jgi:hypothetical protein